MSSYSRLNNRLRKNRALRKLSKKNPKQQKPQQNPLLEKCKKNEFNFI